MVKSGLLLFILMMLAGCLPQAKQQSCGQGNVFNSTSRSCVPITSGGQTSGVSIAGRNPSVSNFTISRTSGTSLNFSVSINNPLNQGYSINWMLYAPNGTSTQISSSGSGSASFIPALQFNSTSLGVWTLAAEVISSPGNVIVTQTQWFITVVDTPTPTMEKTASPPLSIPNIPGPTLFSVQVDNPGNLTNLAVVWYFNSVQQAGVSLNSSSVFTNSITLFNSTTPLLTGPATVRAEVRQGSASGQIYDYVEWPLFVNPPNFPTISNVVKPALGSLLRAVDNQPLSIRNGTTLLPIAEGFCVTVSSGLGSTNQSGSVIVEYRKNASQVISVEVIPNNGGEVCLGTTDPSRFNDLFLSLSNPNMGEIQSISAQVMDNNIIIATLNWPISVRPRNTAPTVTMGLVTESGGTVEFGPGNAFHYHPVGKELEYQAVANDEDTPPNLLVYHWKFDGVLMNGTNFFPGTSVVTPNCVGTGVTFSICLVTIPTYNQFGRLDAVVNLNIQNSITVQVTDTSVNGAAPLTSNPFSWTARPFKLNSAPHATAPIIAPAGVQICTPSVEAGTCSNGNSFVAMASTPNVALNLSTASLNEGDTVIFNVLISDSQRDNFELTIICEEDNSQDPIICENGITVFNGTINRTNDSFGRRVPVSFTLPQSIIRNPSGSGPFDVTFKVIVQDQTRFCVTQDTSLVCTSESTFAQVSESDDIVLRIEQFNPAPVASGPPVPATNAAINAMVGFPITLDPGPVTDASTADGSTIIYQWQVCQEIGADCIYETIPGANQRVLKWTPSAEAVAIGSLMRIRLCLFDDGFPNRSTDIGCTNLVGPWTTIRPQANHTLSQNIPSTSNFDMASWMLNEGSRQEVYMAYADNSGTNSRIRIEKYAINNYQILPSDNGMKLVKTISFLTEDGAASYAASKISLMGASRTVGGKTYRGLFVSYVTQQTTPGPITPRMRFRYIDITDPDDLIFDYSGIYNSSCVNGSGVFVTPCNTPFTVATQSSADRRMRITFNTFFAADSYIAINGIKLFAVDKGTYTNFDVVNGWGWNQLSGRCEFTGYDSTAALQPTNIELAEIVAGAYDACRAANLATDARFILSPSYVMTTYPTIESHFDLESLPRMHVDSDLPVALGQVGQLMVHDNVVLLPYLDNISSARLAFASLRLRTDLYAYGGLGHTESASNFGLTAAYIPTPSSAPSLEVANSYVDSGVFHVALTTNFQRINSHRFTVAATPTSATLTLTHSKLDVFPSADYPLPLERPRLATGSSALSNNNLFIVAREASTLDKKLLLARLNAATLVEQFVGAIDENHDLTSNLRDYSIAAYNCSGGQNGAILATYTNTPMRENYVLSLRTPTAANSGLVVTPDHSLTPNVHYPRLSEGNSSNNIYVGQTTALTMERVGGLTAPEPFASEATRCVLPVAHSDLSRARLSIVNIQPTPIQASEVDDDGKFQPPYIK